MTTFQNIYYERKVAIPKPCYICKRPTSIVLSTLKTEDFLYTCEGHLSDTASPIVNPTTTPSAEDIKRVIGEYHVREAKKAEAAKQQAKGEKSDEKEKEKEKDKDKDSKDKSNDKAKDGAPLSSPTPSTAAPSHKKYALHRQIFEMRQNELKKREQGVKAREVGKGLPQVPRGMF